MPTSTSTDNVIPSATTIRRAASTSAQGYSYTAPWGGFDGNAIYLDPAGACQHISASLAAGYSWPSFLSTLASGKTVTVYGTPSYNDSWSVQNNCPTGGIVASNIVLGSGSGASSPATPSPAPSAPSGTGGAPVYGGEPPNYDPPANWRPYRSSSTWNQRLANPDNPTLDPGDRSKIGAMFNSAFGSNQYQGRIGMPYSAALAVGSGNGGFPYYFARTSDPSVTINCTAGYGTCPMQGKQFYVPANAGSAQDTDRHMVVIQPNGNELDVWEWGVNFSNNALQTPPWRSGETVNIGWGGTASVPNGTGWDDSGNATAAGNDALAGVIREPEIASGQINHALAASVFCSPTSTPVYPANHSSSQTNCNGLYLSSNQVVAEGSRLWIDLTDTQINQLGSVTNAQKAALHALHDYGAFVTDTNSYDPLSIGGLESQMPGYAYGNDIVGQWAAANLPEWYAYNGATWYYLLSANDLNTIIEPHIHVLAPCVNAGYPGGQC